MCKKWLTFAICDICLCRGYWLPKSQLQTPKTFLKAFFFINDNKYYWIRPIMSSGGGGIKYMYTSWNKIKKSDIKNFDRNLKNQVTSPTLGVFYGQSLGQTWNERFHLYFITTLLTIGKIWKFIRFFALKMAQGKTFWSFLKIFKLL